jgi:mannose-1-phosphate guanylyltransferase
MKQCDLHQVMFCVRNNSRVWSSTHSIYLTQLLNLIKKNYTLLQGSLLRAYKASCKKPTVSVCNSKDRYLVGMQSHTNHLPEAIYFAKVSRHTSPAISLATLHLAANPSRPNLETFVQLVPVNGFYR